MLLISPPVIIIDCRQTLNNPPVKAINSMFSIADIYKSRLDIELFFKWMKQHFKIKTFIGTSENAVKIQIWTAMIAYLLTEYIRFKSKTSFPILKIFRILSENLLFHCDIFLPLMGKPQFLLSKTETRDLQFGLGF